MHFLERFGFVGLNVTSPHKQAILTYAQDVDGEVRQLEAANTLMFTKNGWKAYNTDGYGFGRQLDICGIDPSDKSILIFGGGGAAKAVVKACLERGVRKLTVVNRTETRIAEIRALFPDMIINYSPFEKLNDCYLFDILINAASVDWSNRIWRDRFWAGREDLFSPSVVIDLQYMPRITPFMSLFHSPEKYNGFIMLVEQAAQAFGIWHGSKPDYSVDELERVAYAPAL